MGAVLIALGAGVVALLAYIKPPTNARAQRTADEALAEVRRAADASHASAAAAAESARVETQHLHILRTPELVVGPIYNGNDPDTPLVQIELIKSTSDLTLEVAIEDAQGYRGGVTLRDGRVRTLSRMRVGDRTDIPIAIPPGAHLLRYVIVWRCIADDGEAWSDRRSFDVHPEGIIQVRTGPWPPTIRERRGRRLMR